MMHVYEIDGREWVRVGADFQRQYHIFVPVETETLKVSYEAFRLGAIGESIRQVEA